MRSWYFSEQSYYPAWAKTQGAPRVTPPSDVIDPAVAKSILEDCIEEWKLADQMGLNIMVNEHYAGYLCMSVSCMITLGILASHTRKARLLALGIPLLNRMDPLRIAEEIGYVDTLSGGRLEIGLVKGSPFEVHISNANAGDGMRRFYEAHDLVLKALSTRSGSFSYESPNFDYRHVNVMPPSCQQPHPQVWLTTLSTKTAREAAKRGHVLAITASAPAARRAFPVYREVYRETFHREAPLDRFAFLGYCGIGRTEKEGMERARKVMDFVVTSERTPSNFLNPPGFHATEDVARILKAGTTRTHRAQFLPDGTPMSPVPIAEDYVKSSVMFAGSPDQVFHQIKDFYDSCGGFGNFLIQMGGMLTSEEIRDQIRLFANEVQPRLEELHRHREAAA